MPRKTCPSKYTRLARAAGQMDADDYDPDAAVEDGLRPNTNMGAFKIRQPTADCYAGMNIVHMARKKKKEGAVDDDGFEAVPEIDLNDPSINKIADEDDADHPPLPRDRTYLFAPHYSVTFSAYKAKVRKMDDKGVEHVLIKEFDGIVLRRHSDKEEEAATSAQSTKQGKRRTYVLTVAASKFESLLEACKQLEDDRIARELERKRRSNLAELGKLATSDDRINVNVADRPLRLYPDATFTLDSSKYACVRACLALFIRLFFF